jgi:site-specific recombinase XerC
VEIQSLFDACDSLRDKSILTTTYGLGLRLNEVACLKVSDIDSKKMHLLIPSGKGSKDRIEAIGLPRKTFDHNFKLSSLAYLGMVPPTPPQIAISTLHLPNINHVCNFRSL